MPFAKPCLDCGELTRDGNRCERHQAIYRRKRNQRLDSLQRQEAKRAKYTTQYKKRAKLVRESATHCHLCRQPFKSGDKIEADHLYPELNDASPLLPAHAHCNASRGNKPLNL